jgi:hypothetical protein
MTAVGLAAKLDEQAATRAHYEALAAQAAFPRMLVLLKLARAELSDGPLAQQIDDMLYGRTPPEITSDGLILERLPNGQHAWLRVVA